MAIDLSETTTREAAIPLLEEYIVATSETCGGEPRIAGTRIKVRHIFSWVEQRGWSVAQVVENYPHLSRAAVHAALAYYWSHPDEIHRAIAEESRLIEELKAKNGASATAEKQLEASRANGSDDPIPSR